MLGEEKIFFFCEITFLISDTYRVGDFVRVRAVKRNDLLKGPERRIKTLGRIDFVKEKFAYIQRK